MSAYVFSYSTSGFTFKRPFPESLLGTRVPPAKRFKVDLDPIVIPSKPVVKRCWEVISTETLEKYRSDHMLSVLIRNSQMAEREVIKDYWEKMKNETNVAEAMIN